MGTGVVVGIEGSPAGRAALEWAFREGLARGTTVTVVHAWGQGPGRDVEAVRASSCMVVAAIAEAERAVGGRPPVVECSRAGAAARVLIEEAADADLLVVGRGHRAGVVDVIGHSVSAEVVRHASCPVVIVPAPTAESSRSFDVTDAAMVVGATLD
jgi:nucleotide-binding universal stress UspA family protein